jgi:hypothetical protein
MLSFSMEWAPSQILDFSTSAEAFLQANGPHHVQALQNEFQDVFGNPCVLRELGNTYLKRVLSGLADNGDPVIGNDSLVLRYSPALTLRILKDRSDVHAFGAKPADNIVTNYPANTLILINSSEPMTVEWFCREEGADFDRFDSTLKIRHEATVTYQNASVLYVDARKRFPVLPARRDDTFVVLAGAAVNAQIVSFDTQTLRPVGASMASDISSVLCVMLDLLDARQSVYPLDAVVDLTRHADHHVRWAAVCALGKHSRGLALDIVNTLAIDDPHRFVRDAAQRTLIRQRAHVQ